MRAKNTRNVLLKGRRKRERELDFFPKVEGVGVGGCCCEKKIFRPQPLRPASKNQQQQLKKKKQTLIDKLVSGIVYWAFGFAFAYGDTAAGGLIGRSYFFLADRLGAAGGAAGAVAPADGGSGSPQARAAAVLALWFSSWVFLITATTIVSGCLAERARFEVRRRRRRRGV